MNIKKETNIELLDELLGVVMTDYTRAKLLGDRNNAANFMKEADEIKERIKVLKER